MPKLPFGDDEAEGTIAARFRKVAAVLPDQPAVFDGTTGLTFAELIAWFMAVRPEAGRRLPSEAPPGLRALTPRRA